MSESLSLFQTAHFFNPQQLKNNNEKRIANKLDIKQFLAARPLIKLPSKNQDIKPKKLNEFTQKAPHLLRNQNNIVHLAQQKEKDNQDIIKQNGTRHKRNESEPNLTNKKLITIQSPDKIRNRMPLECKIENNLKNTFCRQRDFKHQIFNENFNQIKKIMNKKIVQNRNSSREIRTNGESHLSETRQKTNCSMMNLQFESSPQIPRSQSQQEIRQKSGKSFLQRRAQLKILSRIFKNEESIEKIT